MKFVRGLLEELVKSSRTLEEFEEKLTLHAFEVEETRRREIPAGVVMGKISGLKRHENADKLWVCQLDCGARGNFQIVTGAENVAENAVVPVALPGTELPVVGLKIEPRKMRGEESKGMICAREELGLPDESGIHGIWRLDQDFVDFQNFADFFGRKLEEFLGENGMKIGEEIRETKSVAITHRPDLFGHRGLAWEVAALDENSDASVLEKKLEILEESFENPGESLRADPRVETEAVASYSTLEFAGVSAGETPAEIRGWLEELGVTPRSAWVDLTNFFVMNFGLPIHVFDAAKISGGIVVREAASGEEFVDLRGKMHALEAGDLVIADEEKILALAGILGGKTSWRSEETERVVVEFACFDPVKIRKTAQRLGLRTEASTRFEKGVSPARAAVAWKFLFGELERFFGGNLPQLKKITERNSGNFGVEKLPLSSEKIAKKLGRDAGEIEDFVAEKFPKLGLKIEENAGEKFVVVPPWRADLKIVEDLVEEVARLRGMDFFAEFAGEPVVGLAGFAPDLAWRRRVEEIAKLALGGDQLETYPRISDDLVEIFGIGGAVRLVNSRAPETSALRGAVWQPLLTAAVKNARLFAAGLTVWDCGSVRATEQEKLQRGGVRVLPAGTEQDFASDEFLAWKNEILKILKLLGWERRMLDEKIRENSALHPKKSLEIRVKNSGEMLGRVGQLHPVASEKLGFEAGKIVLVAEIDFIEIVREKSGKFWTQSAQILEKDLSFVMEKNQSLEKLGDLIGAENAVLDWRVRDVFVDEKLGAEKKSVALRLRIEHDPSDPKFVENLLLGLAERAKPLGFVLRN